MSKRAKKYLGFNDLYFRIIGGLIVGTSMPFLFFDHSLSNPFDEGVSPWIVSFLMTFVYWEGNRQILMFWRQRIPDVGVILKRNLIQLVTVVAYSFFIEIAIRITLEQFLFSDQEDHGLSGMAGTYLITFLIVAIYEAVYLYHQLRNALLEKEKAKQEQVKSELEGLRNQVNPHFLFNSLNTLMNIISENPDDAVEYLQKMSQVFRRVLEKRKEPLVRLEEELAFMENYLFLQKERFRDNLRIKINIPDELKSKMVIPLSLQLLFENAIKHNIISNSKPLCISVFSENGEQLWVINTLQRKNQIMNSTKVGLDNIRNRYQYFTDKKVIVEETNDEFKVSIPLINIQPKSRKNESSDH